VTVNRRMPVKASVEGRVERARAFDLARFIDDMAGLIWILSSDTSESQTCEF